MKILRLSVIAVVLSGLAVYCGCGKNGEARLSLESANDLLTRYVSALAEGDSTGVSRFWSKESRDREGFWHMHVWRGSFMPLSQWREFLQDFTFEITNVRPENEYHVIDLKWIQKDTATNEQKYQPRDMLYYIIWEDEHWALINPIDVLTRGWQTYETDYLIFHYPEEIDIQAHLAELEFMDDECERALEIFDLDLTRKIDFYKARTPNECGDLLLQRPSNGYASVGFLSRKDDSKDSFGFRIVVSTSFINPHEVVHLLTAFAGIRYVNAALFEGIASAFGGNTQTTSEFTLIESKNLIGHPMHFPLSDLLTLSDADFLRNNFVTYFEAGAFVRFLTERFGMDKFKELCIRTKVAEELHKTIPEIYGHSIDELEVQLQDYLLKLDAPQVEFTIPSDAELVFSMTDPAGDDRGDGDYSYPRHERFEKGVFDLRKFEVLKDDSHAYFRLQFHNSMGPVSYGSGTEKFVPGVVIAINKGAKVGRSFQQYCHGVQFEEGEGYDFKLNVGLAVSVSNEFGKVYFSTPDVYANMCNGTNNTIEFSFPIDFIGEPESAWKYFVGVGLVSDRTMNFLNAGVFPVYKDHPIFISGGNYEHGNPAFIDILLPKERNQAGILGKYDAKKGIYAVVPMVGPGSP
jgi:hypothetical protein